MKASDIQAGQVYDRSMSRVDFEDEISLDFAGRQADRMFMVVRTVNSDCGQFSRRVAEVVYQYGEVLENAAGRVVRFLGLNR